MTRRPSLLQSSRSVVLTLLTVLSVTAPAVMASEGPQVLSSGEGKVTLLELYTSEGCSSCPPADRWVSGLVRDPRLWRDVVPVSFHVDYWDWIGWRDRFADPAYSERQRRHIDEGNARVVYTPGFFADGEEWRGFFDRAPLEPSGGPAGELVLTIGNGDVTVRFNDVGQASGRLDVTVALLGMGLDSDVSAGENRGRSLQHDFVVLGLAEARLVEQEDGRSARMELPEVDEQPLAIAGWVTGHDSQRPLQAVGGYLDRSP